MKDQIIELSAETSSFSYLHVHNKDEEVGYWLQVYQPLTDECRIPVSEARQLCPWAMAAEFKERKTTMERRQQLLDALKKGLITIKLYGLPPNRIMFMENNISKQITVWVD